MAADGNDELMGELDDLEALAAEEEMQSMDLPVNPAIIIPDKPVPEAEMDDEQMLKKMMAM